MLSKDKRLTRARDFELLAVKGRPIFGPFLTLRIRKSGEDKPRIGFITSTKVMKKAVDRNRAKRRMRSVMRELYPEVPERFHLLFILKPEVKTVPYQALKDEVRRLLLKIPEALTKPPKLSPSAIKRQAKHQAKKHASSPTSAH